MVILFTVGLGVPDRCDLSLRRYGFHFGESTQLKTPMSNRVSGMSSYTRGVSGVKPSERKDVNPLIYANFSDISYGVGYNAPEIPQTMWRRHVLAYEHNAPDFPCLVKALEDMALHKRK